MKGSPIKVKINDIVIDWQKLCEAQLDAHVAVSGDEGAGKSQFIYDTVVNKLKGDPWNNIVYTENLKEFEYKYELLEAGMPMGFDESLNILGRLDWSKLQTKNLVTKFRADVHKEKTAIWLYGIQIFRDLHSFWRTHRIRHWIEIAPRQWFREGTMAFYLERQRVPFLTGRRDTWLLDEEEKRWMVKMRNGPIIGEEYMMMLRTHPFYKGEFRLQRLEEKDEKKYAECRAEAMDVYKSDPVEEKINKNTYVYRANSKLTTAINALLSQGHTHEDVGKILDLSTTDISTHLSRYLPYAEVYGKSQKKKLKDSHSTVL